MESLPPGILIKQINNYAYNTDSVIGKGYSSSVYKGRNSLTKEIVAIKVMDIRSAKNEIEKMLLNNQIKALSMVAHDNVIKCHEICQTVNNLYVVMEYCQQGSLSEFVKTHGKIREDQALAILYYIAQGLQHIHSKGFLHRDLKPTNILIRNGVPKIADFGFAVPATDAYARATYNVGSPLYMSPEAYKKSEYSLASDVWGLGVIFYEMVIGGAPFRGMDYDTMVRRVHSREIFNSLQIGPVSRELLYRMLTVDTKQRIALEEVIAVLQSNKPIPSTLSHPSAVRSELKPQRSTDQLLKPRSNGSQLSPSQMRSRQNSPIKELSKDNSQIKSQEYSAREFQDRLLLGDLVSSVIRALCEGSEAPRAPQLIHLLLKHWRYNMSKLSEVNPHHPQVLKEEQKIHEAIERIGQPSGEPYFVYLVNKGHPQSETYCDYTLFWLRESIKHDTNLLDQLLTAEKLDEGQSLSYLQFMLVVRYCQVIDFIRNGDSGGLFPPNEVLDWLIRDYKNVTSEAVEYLRAISNVLSAAE